MNIGFYGHAKTFVLNYNHDGKYYTSAMTSGIQLLATAVIATDYSFTAAVDANDDTFRREYFEMSEYIAEGRIYHAISRRLGYQDGTTPNNILYLPPSGDASIPYDLLFVVDEGYGGIELPHGNGSVVWMSDNALPDREQFLTIAERAFLWLDADVLRRAGAMISRQISWERTIADLIRELQSNPAISYIAQAKSLFITFSVDGGVFIRRQGDGSFEAAAIIVHGGCEGTIVAKREGENIFTQFGMYSLFANQLIKNIDSLEQEMLPIIRQLLEAGEALYLQGMKVFEGSDSAVTTVQVEVEIRHWPAFAVPVELNSDDNYRVPDDWTITTGVGGKELYSIAFKYVQEGDSVIDGLPQLSLGQLTTIDRWEIEAYQNISNLILDYARSEVVRPLSIAVFGSPGSGKSFGVTQIAKNILPKKVEKLEFNVSQFTSSADLGVAFQKVRDAILEGKLPLVFFDEFDSDRDGVALGWLKTFLMPMQDGKFRDESGEHPLGKCILVFAGGTAPDFETFTAPLYSDEAAIWQGFKNVKGPDFVSRLRGSINVLGPNKRSDSDKNHILRRALLLRSLAERKLGTQDGKILIAPAIIRAMLLVPEFRHGARSMEAILDMSRIEAGGMWEPASLPFVNQLQLHVDGSEFLRLVLSD